MSDSDFSIDPATTVEDDSPDLRMTAAVLAFDVQAKAACADLIGMAHMLYFQRRLMSPRDIRIAIENITGEIRNLNSAFAALERAHARATVGETASRIRAAATGE
jgi:hypothetical protein